MAARRVLCNPDLVVLLWAFQPGLPRDLYDLVAECRAIATCRSYDDALYYLLPARYERSLASLKVQIADASKLELELEGDVDVSQKHLVSASALFLCEAAPAAMLAMHLLVLTLDLERLHRWLRFQSPPNVVLSSNTLDFAARCGRIEVLEYLLIIASPMRCSSRGYDAAAKYGCLPIVDRLERLGVPCTEAAIDGAALHGHLAVVAYLHGRGKPCTTLAMSGAAAKGHLEVVRYLHVHRHEGCTSWAMIGAVTGGFERTIAFLQGHRPECAPTLRPPSRPRATASSSSRARPLSAVDAELLAYLCPSAASTAQQC
ncbi:hypothetical protein SDRG_07212 [Saprolegnia diclina VS20]|uniref:Uncharacterized protein n=1 Tax=Saprolegnia diclina (strain VS20) TaxID=1156394 RepID=T0QCB0_SAPDV|nr:hypothetical protein SDRG_07212 [Saprolegnia diclina VS20]EQC35504.1 hypothetical protein SDRG_07212 [Saprolegnia diclina VS20]|eukprot:XP_008611254.1 hypothetical protein SDRG_07212 [Saprolegnia diclina VS20]